MLSELFGRFQILALEAAQGLLRQHLFDAGLVVLAEVGVLVELGFEALDFLEVAEEGSLGGVALQIRHGGWRAVEALGLHEAIEHLHGGFPFLDHNGSLVDKPDFPRLLAGLLAGEEGDGGIHGLLLLAEVEDVAVGLGAVEHPVGAGKGLDETVVPQVLVHVERVQELGIEASQQHVHHDGDIDLLRGRIVGIRPLLVFDALLHILVVEIELAEAVIGAVAGVVIGEDGLEGFLFHLRLNFVVRLLLR